MSLKGIKIINDIHTILFPRVCFGCNATMVNNERYLCTVCRHKLPLTNFHRVQENPIEKIFYGRVPVKAATSFLFFEKNGIVQELIHQLKYRNQEEIGAFLGDWMGPELSKHPVFNTIDVVIPVPLHKNKFKKRGYNQVTLFAKHLAKHLNATYVNNVLLKTSKTKTQTLKNRLSRWLNTQEVYELSSAVKLENKHILLVDDIITTGATLESCATTVLQAKNCTISIATMAYTK